MTDTIDPYVLEQFDIERKVGQGAYGIVWKAYDRHSRNTVALKKCFDACVTSYCDLRPLSSQPKRLTHSFLSTAHQLPKQY